MNNRHNRHNRNTLHIHIPAPPTSTPTRAICHAAASLGYLLDDPLPRQPQSCSIPITSASITLITGPSGCGKSTLLKQLQAAAKDHSIPALTNTRTPSISSTAIDALRLPTDLALNRLAEVGLADHSTFTRRIHQLSEGQLHRFQLALLLTRADKLARSNKTTSPILLILDEFATKLDTITAQSLAHSFARAIRTRPHITAAIATPHHTLAAELNPTSTIRLTLQGEPNPKPIPTPQPIAHRIATCIGTTSDYQPLARYHYRPGTPAAVVRTRLAFDTHTGEVVAALLTTMPALNSSWRKLAWQNDYASNNRAHNIKKLNDEVRRIARVVVDPRYRALGIAKRLVKEELQNPLTIRTEAIAAMGPVSPFFERAGMTAYPVPRSSKNARLLDFLQHAGIEPWRIPDAHSVWHRLNQPNIKHHAIHELNLWRQGSAAPKPARHTDDPQTNLRWACRTIAAHPIAYAAQHPSAN